MARRRCRTGVAFAWSPEIGWVVGLMTSDGNLGRTGYALSLTSNDVELLDAVRGILGLDNTLGHVRGGWGTACHRLQWRDRAFHGRDHEREQAAHHEHGHVRTDVAEQAAVENEPAAHPARRATSRR